jgi:omega-amidase
MRIALVSLDQAWLDRDANFARCEELVRAAAAVGCDLAVFPEMTLTGYCLDGAATGEAAHGSPTLQRFGELAMRCQVDLIFGAALVGEEGGPPHNTLCLARRNGEAAVLYSKVHPFSFAGEDRSLAAGASLGLASVAGLRLGTSVCYDLRFPELYSAMAPHCDAVINIANWPSRRVAHWRALLVARAIENQLFVLGVNRIGTDGTGLDYEKSSLAVSPEGVVLEPVTSRDEMDVYEVDPALTRRYREEFPTLRDKRYGLYRELFEANR